MPVPSQAGPPTPPTFSPPHPHLLLREVEASYGDLAKSFTPLEAGPSPPPLPGI